MPKKGTTNTPGEVLSSAAGGSAGGSFAEDGDQAEALERARLARDWMCVSDTSREVSATITLDGNRVDVSCIEVLLYGRRVPNTTKIVIAVPKAALLLSRSADAEDAEVRHVELAQFLPDGICPEDHIPVELTPDSIEYIMYGSPEDEAKTGPPFTFQTVKFERFASDGSPSKVLVDEFTTFQNTLLSEFLLYDSAGEGEKFKIVFTMDSDMAKRLATADAKFTQDGLKAHVESRTGAATVVMDRLTSTQLDPHLWNAAKDYFNSVYATFTPIEELLGRSASSQLDCTRTVTTSTSSVSAGKPTTSTKAAMMEKRRIGVLARYNTSSTGAFRRATAEHTPNRQLNNARHQDGYVPDHVNGHLEMIFARITEAYSQEKMRVDPKQIQRLLVWEHLQGQARSLVLMLKDYYVGKANFLTEFEASEMAAITAAPTISRSLCTSPLVRLVVNRDVLDCHALPRVLELEQGVISFHELITRFGNTQARPTLFPAVIAVYQVGATGPIVDLDGSTIEHPLSFARRLGDAKDQVSPLVDAIGSMQLLEQRILRRLFRDGLMSKSEEIGTLS